MLRLRALLAPVVVLALASVAHAGPWIPQPGHFYLELRAGFASAGEGFDRGGGRHPLGSIGPAGLARTRLYDAQGSLYGEVGIATRLAVVADFAWLRSLRLGRAGPDATALGSGDLRAGLRLLLLDEEVTCALEGSLGIPTGRSDGAVPLGPGDLRGELGLSVGHAGQRVPLFFVLALGAVLRSSGEQRVAGTVLVGGPATESIDYASELVYAAQLGWVARLGERVRLAPRVQLDGRHGLRAPTTAARPTAGEPVLAPIAPESVRLLRLGAGLSIEAALRRRGAGAVIVDVTGGAFVWGQGLPAAAQGSLALGWKR